MRRENWRQIYRLNTFFWHISCRNCVWYLFYTRFIKIYTCQTQNCAGNKTACTRRHVSTKSAIQTDCKKGNLAKRYNVRTQGPSRGETNAVIHQPYIAIHLPYRDNNQSAIANPPDFRVEHMEQADPTQSVYDTLVQKIDNRNHCSIQTNTLNTHRTAFLLNPSSKSKK